MTHLRQAMLEELQRRNYARTTIHCYIQAVERFAKYFHTPPDQLNHGHLRTYQAYLLRERKLGPRTVKLHVSALRFFFVKTLKRPYMLEDLPFPKVPRRLPAILTHGRSHPIDRWGAEPDRSHDAHGAVLDRHAERRAASPAGPRHRQSAHADSHSAREGRSRSVRPAQRDDCWRRSACTTAGCGRRRGCSPARFRTGGPTSRSPRRSCGRPVASPPPAPSLRNASRPISSGIRTRHTSSKRVPTCGPCSSCSVTSNSSTRSSTCTCRSVICRPSPTRLMRCRVSG